LSPHTSTIFNMSGSIWEISGGVRRTLMGMASMTRLWDDGRLIPAELGRSSVGFALGITTYWIVIRFLDQLGVHSVAIQTVGWFGATLVSDAVVTGEFRDWGPANQIVALGVALGIGWLMVTTGTQS
jgi:hypothetical protein